MRTRDLVYSKKRIIRIPLFRFTRYSKFNKFLRYNERNYERFSHFLLNEYVLDARKVILETILYLAGIFIWRYWRLKQTYLFYCHAVFN